MKIIHESTVNNFDGTIDISIIVVNDFKLRRYTYHLSSEFAARKFHQFYKMRLYGRALQILNRFKIK